MKRLTHEEARERGLTWCETDRCYYKLETWNFTGPQATATLTDGEGWIQKESPKTVKSSAENGHYPSAKELKGKAPAPLQSSLFALPGTPWLTVEKRRCACGRQITGIQATRCATCRRLKRHMGRKAVA